MDGWIEIFRTGTFLDTNGRERTFDVADLARIVVTYDPSQHEAPLVIGRPDATHPAWGWVEKLKLVGDRLMMLPRQVVPAFAAMIRDGRFKKRTISLYPDGRLRHVGFLGAAPPPLPGLEDMAFRDIDECIEYQQCTSDLFEVSVSGRNGLEAEVYEDCKMGEEIAAYVAWR